ncbi:peptidase M48 [bacterium]|nr:MAG: peptidase M48 [bacterium]
MRKVILTHLLLVLLASACTYQINPITGRKRAYAYTWSQEVNLGKEADAEIIQEYGLYNDPKLSAYIEEMGQKILKESHLRRETASAEFQNTPFTFRLLDSPVVNAFALPGGYVYVTRGLLAHLNNEAQLAVVLGHEIGHVAGRHHSKRALQQKAGQVALMGGAVLGEKILGVPGQEIAQLGGQASAMLFLSYSRDDETESDVVGVEYAAKSGYRTSEASEFFVSLKRISDQYGRIPTLQSSHPDPGDREQNMKRLYEAWKQKGFEQKTVEQGAYKKRLEGLLVGDNPRNGFVKNGVFYHPDLKFLFSVPTDWQLINEPTRVILVDKAQKGVLVLSSTQKASTAEVVVNQFLAQEGITTLSKKAVTINTFKGYQSTAKAQTEQGEIGIFYAAVEYNGSVYAYMGYSEAAQFDAYLPYFFEPFQKFNRLTDSSILGIQATKMKLVEVTEAKPFQQLLPLPLPVGTKDLDWAIMNQVELNESIPKGTILKLY